MFFYEVCPGRANEAAYAMKCPSDMMFFAYEGQQDLKTAVPYLHIPDSPGK
jgi:hypothetical protein